MEVNPRWKITAEARALVVAAIRGGANNRIAAEAGGTTEITARKIRALEGIAPAPSGRPRTRATKQTGTRGEPVGRVRVGLSLAPDEAARLDAAREPGEARATTAHRLIVVAL